MPGCSCGTPFTLSTHSERGPPGPLDLHCLELRRSVLPHLLYALDALARMIRGRLSAIA